MVLVSDAHGCDALVVLTLAWHATCTGSRQGYGSHQGLLHQTEAGNPGEQSAAVISTMPSQLNELNYVWRLLLGIARPSM